MKYVKLLVILLLAGFALAVGGGAWAHDHRGHAHVGVFIGAPLWPWYYPPPYYYYPPVVTVPAAPPVYVEQGSPPASEGYWYYCKSGGAYYPYLKECPEGWQKVAPQP